MRSTRALPLAGVVVLLLAAAVAAQASPTVPTEIQQPGTQPLQVPAFTSPNNCDNCHAGITQPVNPGQEKERDPAFGWRGGMMANAGRDALFWATVAVAEQDFLPSSEVDHRGGVGDLCIRCHSVGGWIAGRSTPTNGSGLSTSSDTDGVECEFCHQVVNPDPAISIAGTTEMQTAPFEAFDPVTGEPYLGSGEYVLNGNGIRLGPYTDAAASHQFLPSPYHRKGEMCGTCHDVSNAAVGDLAHNNGSMIPLVAGTFSGVPGSPVDGKAAFNNPPYRYGTVERTSSEWTASALDTLNVNSYPTLPADLRVPGGSLDRAYHRAYDARANASYVDGTARTFTCQTCHMSASTGKGCNKNGVPTRQDLPRHDQTGGSYWAPDLVQYQDSKGTLRLGGGLTQTQRDALNAGKVRAQEHLQSAASLAASQTPGGPLTVKVTNLTGHKLITGYPEGRRMWLNLRWYDAGNQLVREDGAYGPIGRSVADNAGVLHSVQSLLDLESTPLYEAKPGMDQAWAAQLLSLGYPASLPLMYDRMDDQPEHTLGQLGAAPAGTAWHTFHFALNNVAVSDTRIPPYGFRYDEARTRSALPIPETQFGDPGPGGTYRYWDERTFAVPAGATRVEARLYYQQTSWEYVHFLWKANDGADAFLGQEGRNLLDAWLNTGMSAPFQMAMATANVTAPAQLPGEGLALRPSWNAGTSRIEVAYTAACDATDHTLVWGDLGAVATYTYAGAVCGIGTSGTASFDPGGGSVFFLVVGSTASAEGSYGLGVAGAERPEFTGGGVCARPQQLGAACMP
ncbi:MAG TPA: hypothetical protein VFV75_02005 [Candidatus Polarisedimenticolaceae bacterium]|nr:hypothetical protein [Candidatus Polarisedimenticolaceae bacterium]